MGGGTEDVDYFADVAWRFVRAPVDLREGLQSLWDRAFASEDLDDVSLMQGEVMHASEQRW